ncbi:MAG: sigma-70 family RNA polymerase sigma factor [Verrucomicrobiota bacterium]
MKPCEECVKVNEPADLDLMLETASRNTASFAKLHSRFAGAIYTTAYKVLNNPTDAEEVTQDVFTQIWEKAGLYEPKKGKPLTWAATMARNRAIDRLRANQRRFKLRDRFQEEKDVLSPTETDESALKQAESNEDAKIVRTGVQQLTSDQREAIELVYFAGLTQREAAEQLHQPLGTVKARIRRGIAKLREDVIPKLES